MTSLEIDGREVRSADGEELLVVREMTELAPELSDALFEVHLESFGLLRDVSAMRHVYRRDEWDALMADTRISKHVAFLDGVPVGVNTGTLDLDAVPWLSKDFFADRFGGRPVLYDWDTIIGEQGRGTRVVRALFEAGFEFARRHNAIVTFSVTQNHLSRKYLELLQRVVSRAAGATIGEVDSYHYFAFDPMTYELGDDAWEPEVPAVTAKSATAFRDLAPGIHRQRLVVEGKRAEPISAVQIVDYLSALSEQLGMITLLEPVTHQSDKYGWAGWIHWETSGAHFYAWDDPVFFSVDIYTCVPFDNDRALEFTREFFDATEIVALPVG